MRADQGAGNAPDVVAGPGVGTAAVWRTGGRRKVSGPARLGRLGGEAGNEAGFEPKERP